jgi:putative restriction endonuclease
MEFYVGITDPRWFTFLSGFNLEDVNFWRPGETAFKAVPQGGPFVFKLKGRINKIVGLGFFYQYIRLPLSVAWDTFGIGNGFSFLNDFAVAIEDLRRNTSNGAELGCIVLTNPIFFSEQDWLDVPPDWKSNIQSGITYSTDNEVGRSLWEQIELRLQRYLSLDLEQSKSLAAAQKSSSPEYNMILSKVRIGQAAFRTSVTSAYEKRCSITGEKTLPVLEAAHIKSYAKSGPNLTVNGLLLRSDLHRLFDAGYLTVTPELKIEVSSRIRTEFENGREYYQFHGKGLVQMPKESIQLPRSEYLTWHNENIFHS